MFSVDLMVMLPAVAYLWVLTTRSREASSRKNLWHESHSNHVDPL